MTEAGAAAAPGRRLAGPGWSGLLPVDKPAGPTSHDVVALARRRFGGATGHLGTLDPGATGLLVLALGAATRCALVWQGGEKFYEGVARLGIVTDTQDTSGRVLETRPVEFSEAAIREAAAAHLTGELLQVPPMVSALKHRGERLYDLARRGETVERAPRPAFVAGWEWLAFASPEATFRVRCSGGTYVRTLVHDLGARLGCGAALASLRRLESAPFTLERACSWAELESGQGAELLAAKGIELSAALAVLPAVPLTGVQADALGRGQSVPVDPGGAPIGAGERSVVFRDAGGRALALGELRRGAAGNAAFAHPHVVFPWAVREGRA